MEKTTNSLKFLQKRKFLMVLPILVLPFVTLLFWALGGGKGNAVSAQQKQSIGLNPELPKAFDKGEKFLSKLSFYEKADKDSAKYRELIKGDPYYIKKSIDRDEQLFVPSYDPLPPQLSHRNIENFTDPNEEKVYRKLTQLNEHINEESELNLVRKNRKVAGAETPPAVNSGDIDRLENMMRVMKEGSSGQDPEMAQLNQLLEKILDVQHPERVEERNNAEKSRIVNAIAGVDDTVKSEVYSKTKTSSVFFYTSQDDTEIKQKTITAAVDESQVLVSGGVVKLRLLEDLKVKGQNIPKGQLLYGIADLNNERLFIEITSIRFANTIYPVKLQVYDLDGIKGVYVPGAISRDVAKQSANNAVQSLELMSLDRSFSAQAAAAGVNAAKNLLTKKVRQVKVTLKAGYRVMLQELEPGQ